MNTSKNKNLSIWLLFAVFAVALALRLIRLGVLPLGKSGGLTGTASFGRGKA